MLSPRQSAEPDVSIHAPARGATFHPVFSCFTTTGFNPRAREGRDRHAFWFDAGGVVSIHAPARGATSIYRRRTTSPESFNPRAARGATRSPSRQSAARRFQSTRPRGARPSNLRAGNIIIGFQSTRPRGARPARRIKRTLTRCFNPRAREGRDVRY